MATATELFPSMICIRCGAVGITRASAGQHGYRKCSVRSLPEECELCKQGFHDLVEIREGKRKGKMRKRHWKGRRVFEHMMAHRRQRDTTEDFA